jgi:hypothetical protein
MNNLTKITHWTPRVLCILAILLVSMFALDAFEPGQTIWHQLLAFIIHMIPSFILIAVLIFAWKWEKTGGLLFLIVGFVFGVFLFRINYRHNHNLWTTVSIIMAMAFPFVLSGVLFILSHYLKNRDLKEEKNISSE